MVLEVNKLSCFNDVKHVMYLKEKPNCCSISGRIQLNRKTNKTENT